MKISVQKLMLRSCVVALLLTGGQQVAVHAQNPAVSKPDITRSGAGSALSANLSRLAVNPRDVAALIGAGEAALELDDPQAAMGFFGRADDISPKNARVKAGLGRAMLGMQQISEALRLMEQAGVLGYSDARFLSDRGLARDLTGDQAGAQRDYAEALKYSPNDAQTIRRHAVSLGISGQLDLAEKMLQPLLYKSDRSAWRDRAFILAMNGRREQANNITKQVMPPQLATAIQPYMDRMAQLTPIQRAEAVHLGKFPANVTRMAVAPMAPPTVTQQPATQPDRSRRNRRDRDTVQVAAASPAPVPPPAPVQPRAVPAASRTSSVAASSVAPKPVQGASLPASPVPPVIDYSRTEPLTTRTPTSVPPQPAPAVAPVPAPQPVVVPSAPLPAPVPVPAPSIASAPVTPPPQSSPSVASGPERTLAEIMAELKIPENEQRGSSVAVDLNEVAALQEQKRKAKLAAEARAKKEAEAKAKKEAEAKILAEKKRLAANPSRIWVQVGTGRNVSALAYDLKRFRKKFASEIGKKEAGTASWGATNRLVIGPFSSKEKARSFEKAVEQGGNDAFMWISDAGEEISPIGDK